MRAPARVAALDQETDALLVAEVAIVVDGEEIALAIEGEFEGIAHAGAEDLEAAPVGLDAEHCAKARAIVVLAVLGDAEALVTHRPVDAAIDPERRSMHVVAAIADVDAEAGDQFLLLVEHPVAIWIGELVERGIRRDVERAGVPQDARGDAIDVGAEAFEGDGALVGHAISVGVLQADDLLLEGFQLLPIRHAAMDQRALVGDAGAGQRLHQPVGVLADVDCGIRAAVGIGDVDLAVGIDGDADHAADHAGLGELGDGELAAGGGLSGDRNGAEHGDGGQTGGEQGHQKTSQCRTTMPATA